MSTQAVAVDARPRLGFRQILNKKLKRLIFSVIAVLSVLPPPACKAQGSYSEFTTTLRRLYLAKDKAEVDEVWNSLTSSGRIPFAVGDSVAFLYRGTARVVSWMGDFNGWGQSKTFANKAERIPGTDIWILKAALPRDARLDYKILINGDEQILDPFNSSYQWSGVGGGSLNSELHMPDWKEDVITSHLVTGAACGHLEKDLVFNSRELGYQVTYSIYSPPRPEPSMTYPVIYVLDGYEYMHERMGNLPTILDNLIHQEKIEPAIAVFIDHRQPVNRSNNRRMHELAMNEKFARFLTGELLPRVENEMTAGGKGLRRAIIGSSMGGLTATWLSFRHPDLFSRAGAQSPAFWFKPEIYSLCERSRAFPERVFLSSGLIHDAEDGARKMRDVLERIQCPYEYRAVNQGHSWGNWRDLIDDMLIYLIPSPE